MGFADDFMREAKDDANRQMREDARKLKAAYDKVLQTGKGKNVNEIKRLLRDELKKTGYKFSEPELTDLAKGIAEGKTLEVQVKPFR